MDCNGKMTKFRILSEEDLDMIDLVISLSTQVARLNTGAPVYTCICGKLPVLRLYFCVPVYL